MDSQTHLNFAYLKLSLCPLPLLCHLGEEGETQYDKSMSWEGQVFLLITRKLNLLPSQTINESLLKQLKDHNYAYSLRSIRKHSFHPLYKPTNDKIYTLPLRETWEAVHK